MAQAQTLTGTELFFNDDEIIVSKTDLKGNLTYCNNVFLRLAGYTEKECLGQPHSKIRNPKMPRSIFYLLWNTIQSGKEIFAYVVNRSANGDHYWVLAHVTPSKDSQGNITGYHSNRRVPDRTILDTTIIPLYARLLAEEQKHSDRKSGLEASTAMINALLEENGMEYDEYIAGLM